MFRNVGTSTTSARNVLATALAFMLQAAVAAACEPDLKMELIPPPGGGSDRMAPISGRVECADTSLYKVVIYSHTNQYYVQPYVDNPDTFLDAQGRFSSSIYLGDHYVLLLTSRSWVPPATLRVLPPAGGPIAKVFPPVPARPEGMGGYAR